MGTTQQAEERAPGHTTFNIVVNGRAKKVETQVLSFDEVVKLAFPTPQAGDGILFTVTFHNADQTPASGTLVEGQTVKVRNGTSFDVTQTNRS